MIYSGLFEVIMSNGRFRANTNLQGIEKVGVTCFE